MSDKKRPQDEGTPPVVPSASEGTAPSDAEIAAQSTAASDTGFMPPATGPTAAAPPTAYWGQPAWPAQPTTPSGAVPQAPQAGPPFVPAAQSAAPFEPQVPTAPIPMASAEPVGSQTGPVPPYTPAYAPAPPSAPPVGPPPADMSTAPQPQSSGTGTGRMVLIAVIAALIIGSFTGLAAGALGARLVLQTQPPAAVKSTTVQVIPSKTDEPIVAASAAAVPSIVNIDVSEGTQSGGKGGLPQTHPTVPVVGNGSGVAYQATSDGGTYIITNNHVIQDATRITVRNPNGQSWTGTVVGADADNDIAVVKVSGKLPPIKLGDSSKLVVGQTVAAIGSPYGLEHSVTAGVISALARSLPGELGDSTSGTYPLIDVIQTDAAINPGNSGGALVDVSGRLIGINTAIYSDSGAAAGIGFAVPVNTAVRVANELIKGGTVSHPYIGLIGSSITPEIAQSKKLPVQEGALVEDLTPGGGADKAGIKVGDIVTAVDGTPIHSMNDLILQVRRHKAGDVVTLSILRDGKVESVKVTVGNRPAGAQIPTATPSPTSTPNQ